MGDKSRHSGRVAPALIVALSLALALGLACGSALAAENDIRMPVEKGAAPDPLGEMVKPRKPAEAEKAEARKPADKKLEPESVARGEAKKGESEPEAKKPEARKPDAKKVEAPKAESHKAESKKAPEAKKPEPKAMKPKAPAKPDPSANATQPVAGAPAAAKPAPEAKKPAPKAMKPKAPAKADPSANATQQLVDAPAPTGLKPAPAPAPKPEPAPKPAPKPVVDPVAFVMPAGPSNPAPAIELPKEGLYVGDLKIEFQDRQIILRAATSAPVERVTTFYLKEQRRLALDLRGNWAKKGGFVVRYDTGPVKHIVVGEHPDRLRLTLEFREGAVSPGLDPAVVREPASGVSVTIPLAR